MSNVDSPAPAVTSASTPSLSRRRTLALAVPVALAAFVLTDFLGLAVFVCGVFCAVLAPFLKARPFEARVVLVIGLAVLAGVGAYVLLVVVLNLLSPGQPASGSGSGSA